MELIKYRDKPCNCGCRGRDPWHQRYYKRVVTQTSDTTGTARLPFSSRPVPIVRDVFTVNDRQYFGMWEVVCDRVVFDKR